jgi:hypothetical protein
MITDTDDILWGIFVDSTLLSDEIFWDYDAARDWAKKHALPLAHDMWILDQYPTIDRVCPRHQSLRAQPFCLACQYGE